MKDFGVLVPIVTPCAPTGEIDSQGLIAVVDEMTGAGAAGVFVMGSTGRGPWFSLSTQQTVCRTVADHLGSRKPVFAGCMAMGLADIVDKAKTFADAGAEVAVVTAPPYFAYSQEEVERIFLAVADRSPIPVLIYDIPKFAGMKLDAAPLMRLADHNNVIGFKDSSADLDRFHALCRTFADRDNFLLFQGKEHILAESLRAGASGFVVSLVHIAPRLFTDLLAAVRAGDDLRADDLQRRVAHLMELTEEATARAGATSALFHILNALLTRRGVCDNILLAHEGDAPDWLVQHIDMILAVVGEEG